jgi:hypothetical protein
MRLYDGRYALTLTDDERSGRWPDYLSVSVEGEGLLASLVSYDADGFYGLVRYFDDLASDAFNGWRGERIVESL